MNNCPFEPVGLVRFALQKAKEAERGSGTGLSMPLEYRQREIAKAMLEFAMVLMGRPKLKSHLKKACRDFYNFPETKL
jgi:hypothetical protein